MLCNFFVIQSWFMTHHYVEVDCYTFLKPKDGNWYVSEHVGSTPKIVTLEEHLHAVKMLVALLY